MDGYRCMRAADGLAAFREGWGSDVVQPSHLHAVLRQRAAIALLRLGQFDAARATLTEGFIQ
jgi:hypothetical protein